MKSLSVCCYLLLSVLLVSVIARSYGFELPFVGTCRLKDEECQKKCVDQFFELYSQGIPELNIPTMDPVDLGNISTAGSGNANFNLALNMTNVKIEKFANTFCEGVSVKGFTKDGTKPLKLVVKFKTPASTLRSHCNVMGKLLIFNVKGETDLAVYFKNSTTILTVVAEPYKKDNQLFYRIKSFKPKNLVTSMKIELNNSTLLGGDPVFSETFTATLYDNWMVLRDEVTPSLEKSFEDVFSVFLEKILATIPLDRFFKEE